MYFNDKMNIGLKWTLFGRINIYFFNVIINKYHKNEKSGFNNVDIWQIDIVFEESKVIMKII